jgi:hypothetical protein
VHGTFRQIAFADQCTSDAIIKDTLARGSIGSLPLFAAQTTEPAGCVWSIATVSGSAVKALATVPDNLFGESVAAALDKSYWTLTAAHYIDVSASGKLAYLEPLNRGYEPHSVGTSGDGRVYGIEQADAGGLPQNWSLRVTDITDRRDIASLSGWAEGLNLGNDGHLYFNVFSPRDCSIYEIVSPDQVAKRVRCNMGSPQQYAVGRDGTIWQPGFLGVVSTSQQGAMKYVGPFDPVPCVGNIAALRPKSLVITPDNTLWFFYQRLWHVDAEGKLSSIALPLHADGASAMIGTTDGSLWLVVRDGLLQFIPAL